MTDPRPSFDVVCMTLEEPAVVRRFVGHYRALGAARIRLFHDAADLPDFGDLGGQVEVTACDSAFWEALCGARPETLDGRLQAIFLSCYKGSSADWVLCCDADEFVFSDGDIPAFLAAVPDEVTTVSLPTFEAVYMDGDDTDALFGSSAFRLAGRSRRSSALSSRLIYDRDTAPLFKRGLIGHAKGKQFLRTGRDVTLIKSHTSFNGEKRLNVEARRLSDGPVPAVAHFDAISFPRWREKWLRRIEGTTNSDTMGPNRLRQMELTRQARKAGEPELRRLFHRVYGLTDTQFRVLSFLGRAVRRQVILPPSNVETPSPETVPQ